MISRPIVAVLVTLSLVLIGLCTALCAAEDPDCAVAKKALEGKKQMLGEYMVALEKARENKQIALASLLNRKIDELLEQIVKGEDLKECPKQGAAPAQQGLSPVKSDATEYSTKSCDELRSMLVRIMRRTSPLKRRATSTFSELSSSEKEELEEAARESKTILDVMKAKCDLDRGARRIKDARKPKRNYE